MTSIRCCSVNTELIYKMNCLEQEFSVHRIFVEVNDCFTLILLQDSTTQGTDTFECKMTSFFETLHHFCQLYNLHCPLWPWEELPYHFSSDPGPKNVQFPCENLIAVILDFFGIQNTILIIRFPLNVIENWNEDDPVLGVFWLDVPSLQVLLDLLKNRHWWKSCKNVPLEFNCFSIDTHCILVRRIQPECFHLTFPSFYCSWSVLSSVQHIERNQHRHILLPSPIWSLCHWLIPISPKKVMNIPGNSHSEFLQNVPWPTFE